jgi:hypothetical protein
MAKQLGIFPIGGTLDNVTFFQSADGKFSVRKKSSLSAAEIATLPSFQRTRENGREFGRAGKAAKVLRDSLKPILVNVADRKAFARMMQSMMQALKMDSAPRGERTPQDGDLSVLKGFNFSSTVPLNSVFSAPFTATITRLTGALDVAIPAFNPTILLTAPTAATHFKIIMGGSAVAFATETSEGDQTESAYLPITNALTTLLNLTAGVTAATTDPIFLALGIRFYQDLAGVKYALSSNDAVAIVQVDV